DVAIPVEVMRSVERRVRRLDQGDVGVRQPDDVARELAGQAGDPLDTASVEQRGLLYELIGIGPEGASDRSRLVGGVADSGQENGDYALPIDGDGGRAARRVARGRIAVDEAVVRELERVEEGDPRRERVVQGDIVIPEPGRAPGDGGDGGSADEAASA